MPEYVARSACPHDCRSVCALEVPVLAGGRIGRITGAHDNTYTAGVVCAKVARYAERVEHPGRLLHPLRRRGAKGAGEFEPITWEAALYGVRRAGSPPLSEVAKVGWLDRAVLAELEAVA